MPILDDYQLQVLTQFRGVALNSEGVLQELYSYILGNDIARAVSLMQDHELAVTNAIREYNWQTHEVMNRPNKWREGQEPYQTEKLPRTRQRYINEMEVFFLLANQIIWKRNAGTDRAYQLYKDLLRETRYHSKLRQCKRLAGSELESALVYQLYQRNGQLHYHNFVAAYSLGYRLHPLFDQYQNMVAFALGYTLKVRGNNVMHYDIWTDDYYFQCERSAVGWQVKVYDNILGKIPVIYFSQNKSWDGSERRINREEMSDSKHGDNNNYFADPLAEATADVLQYLKNGETVGRMIQLTGKESRFGYVNPPSDSDSRRDEHDNLHDSILFDTFTPDFSFEKMKGLGTISGEALRRALALGYIKRANLMEIYEPLIDRDKNLKIALLKLLHPEAATELDALDIEGQFAEPFDEDKATKWAAIGKLYADGLVSLETAVTMLAITDAPHEEIEKILADAERKAALDKPVEKPTEPTE
ncbi:MAG: phage portal protein [Prevotella sp.]|nr:phage portal protein [Prevotella sp.]